MKMEKILNAIVYTFYYTLWYVWFPPLGSEQLQPPLAFSLLDRNSYLDNCGNSGANTCKQAPTHGGALLLDQNQTALGSYLW